jgi:hypothetical protein
MNKPVFWGKDRKGQSHRIAHVNGHSQASCSIKVEIVSVRFIDQPDNPCPICNGELIFPKGKAVLLHE